MADDTAMRRILSVLVAFAILLPSSCACFKESDKRTPACAIVEGVIDCTKDALASQIMSVKPVVEFLLSGANGDPRADEYLTSLESTGFELIACAGQVVADELALKVAKMEAGPDLPDGKFGASPEKARLKVRSGNVNANFQMWKMKRLPPNTVIKTKK